MCFYFGGHVLKEACWSEEVLSYLSFEVDYYIISGGSVGKRRLTYRLGFCVRDSLECCGSPQCTQGCGPSSLRESSSAAQEEVTRGKQLERRKKIQCKTWQQNIFINIYRMTK